MLTPKDLYEMSLKVDRPKHYEAASDYIETIAVLRDKDLTWKQITQWFHANGKDFSKQCISSAWHNSEYALKTKGGE